MKYFLFLLISLLFLTSGQAQYKKQGNVLFNKTSIVIDSFKIEMGDTLYFGFGSGANKQFIFIHFRPTVLNYDANTGLQSLPAAYANGFAVLKQITIKKVLGKVYPDVVFQLNGSKVKALIDIPNAFQTGEIKRIASDKIDPSSIEVKE